MFYLHVCLCVMHAWYLWRPKRTLDPLGLELQMVVSHYYVILGIEPLILWMKQPFLLLPSSLSSLLNIILNKCLDP